MAGESHAAGGTVTLGNANSVQLTGTDTSYIGIGTTSSTVQVDSANTVTLALWTQGGNATGLYIAGGGTACDWTLTNQGVLAVATHSSAGGARAIGMDVEQGTSATLISQRTGATGGMTVTGGLATGFLVNNVTGPVSVSNSGYIVDVSSTTGDPVSGGGNQRIKRDGPLR